MLALGIQVPAGWIFSRLGRALVNLAAGIGFMGLKASTYGTGRSGKDYLELSGHFFNRVIETMLTPTEASGVLSDAVNLKTGLATGNGDLVRASFIKTQAEIAADWTTFINLISSLVGVAGVAGVAGRPASDAKPPPAP